MTFTFLMWKLIHGFHPFLLTPLRWTGTVIIIHHHHNHHHHYHHPPPLQHLTCCRCAHTTVLIDDKQLIVYGGGDNARRFKDLYILDVERLLKHEEIKRANKLTKRKTPSEKQRNPEPTGNSLPLQQKHWQSPKFSRISRLEKTTVFILPFVSGSV